MSMYSTLSKLLEPGRGVRLTASLAFVLLGAGALCSFNGQDAPGLGSGTGESFAAGGGDDETVGTLPSQDGRPVLDLSRYQRLWKPALYVQGPASEVLGSVVLAEGDRRALVMNLPGGEVRLLFPGSVSVGFDRILFRSAQMRVGVTVPEGALSMRASAAWAGRAFPWQVHAELPVGAFETAGYLDAGPIVAGLVTSVGTTAVRISATQDLLILSQRNR